MDVRGGKCPFNVLLVSVQVEQTVSGEAEHDGLLLILRLGVEREVVRGTTRVRG